MIYNEAMLYFTSGTGNTYRVARWMADVAQSNGVNASVVPIGNGHSLDLLDLEAAKLSAWGITPAENSSSASSSHFDFSSMLASAAILYYIFALLVRIPAINSIFAYTTFTRIYRRYHEPETKVGDL